MTPLIDAAPVHGGMAHPQPPSSARPPIPAACTQRPRNPFYYLPPRKADDSKTAIIVIVIVLVVVLVPIILAAALHVMVSGLIASPDPTPTVVSFAAPSQWGPACWEVVVAGVSDARPLGEFKAALFVNGTSHGSHPSLTA